MRWQGDLPFVQGRRFICDPRQGHFFLDLLNAEQKMELDPKPDEYLIANARAQPHACSFPPAHTHTSSQDVVLCFKRACFSTHDGLAFAGLDYVVCFLDDILIRGLSVSKCQPIPGQCLPAVSRMGWVKKPAHCKEQRFVKTGRIPKSSS